LWKVLQLNNVVTSFVSEVQPCLAAKIDSKVCSLMQFGLGWKTNTMKGLGEYTYELKVGQARLYFGMVGKEELVFVGCHLKKSKSEQSRLIEVAQKKIKDLREKRGMQNVHNIH
jgi:phage-related protein